jgi:hypothetical protein
VLNYNVRRAPAHAFYMAAGYSASATAYIFRKPLLGGLKPFVAELDRPSPAKTQKGNLIHMPDLYV